MVPQPTPRIVLFNFNSTAPNRIYQARGNDITERKEKEESLESLGQDERKFVVWALLLIASS
jgi:hypothetical protein